MILSNDFEDVTTLDAAYKHAGRPSASDLDLSGVPDDLVEVFKAFYNQIVVTEALNMYDGKKWIPDEHCENTVMEEKYLMVIDIWRKKMQYHGYHKAISLLDLSHSKVFALRSLPVVEHFAKHFLHVYGKFMLTSTKTIPK